MSDPIYIDLSSTNADSAVFPCDVDTDTILSPGGQEEYQDYQDYSDQEYQDQSLGGSFEVTWYKDSQELSPSLMMPQPIMSETRVSNFF